MREHRRAFTLIELMVVISIISLLTSIVLASVTAARKKARDGQRLIDMRNILVALETYHDTYDAYPNPNTAGGDNDCSDYDIGPFGSPSDPFIPQLATENLLKAPVDPTPTISNCGDTGTTKFGYFYAWYSAATCPAWNKNFFILGIRRLESSANPSPSSPGWRCPSPGGRNWTAEFYWVTGGIE